MAQARRARATTVIEDGLGVCRKCRLQRGQLNRTGQTVWSGVRDLGNKAYCEQLIDYSIRPAG